MKAALIVVRDGGEDWTLCEHIPDDRYLGISSPDPGPVLAGNDRLGQTCPRYSISWSRPSGSGSVLVVLIC